MPRSKLKAELHVHSDLKNCGSQTEFSEDFCVARYCRHGEISGPPITLLFIPQLLNPLSHYHYH